MEARYWRSIRGRPRVSPRTRGCIAFDTLVSRIHTVLVARWGEWPRPWRDSSPFEEGSCPTLYYAIVFAILALLAGILGFVALAGTLAVIAKSLLFVFLALFVISLIFGRRGGPVV